MFRAQRQRLDTTYKSSPVKDEGTGAVGIHSAALLSGFPPRHWDNPSSPWLPFTISEPMPAAGNSIYGMMAEVTSPLLSPCVSLFPAITHCKMVTGVELQSRSVKR